MFSNIGGSTFMRNCDCEYQQQIWEKSVLCLFTEGNKYNSIHYNRYDIRKAI